MTEDKKPTVKEVLQKQEADKTWKEEPWVGGDGFVYRKNRVKNADGSYTEFEVRVGEAPIVPPKEGK